jgi:hypothetical protein
LDIDAVVCFWTGFNIPVFLLILQIRRNQGGDMKKTRFGVLFLLQAAIVLSLMLSACFSGWTLEEVEGGFGAVTTNREIQIRAEGGNNTIARDPSFSGIANDNFFLVYSIRKLYMGFNQTTGKTLAPVLL